MNIKQATTGLATALILFGTVTSTMAEELDAYGGFPSCLSRHSALFSASCRQHRRPALVIRSRTVGLIGAGTMIWSWLPRPALRIVMTTA